jgi:anti-sigma factor RsiW
MDADFPHVRAADARACRRIRDQLCDGAGSASTVAAHLASCADCAAFAHRLELARQALRSPLAAPAIEPDPHFPARVLARVARPADLLGWAAFRALPAALGLALALAGLGLLGLPPAGAAPASALLDEPPSSDQLLTWSSLSPEVWP